MTFVRTLEDRTPPRRSDQPWTGARIEESALGVTWAPLTTVTFDEPDTDPLKPAARTLTTVVATIASGFFRPVWLDADDNEEPGEPIAVLEDLAARTYLRALVKADCAPRLEDAALDELLLHARRRDSSGLAVDDDEWEPTYDYNAAAAAGWLRKAGAVATATDFQTPRMTNYRSQLQKQCLAMHVQFRQGRRGSMTVVSPTRAAETDLEDLTS